MYQTLYFPSDGIASGLNLYISDRILEEKDRLPKTARDNSVRAVLGRCKDAFETWRYLYERGKVGQVQIFSYEFHFLDNAAEAIRRHMVAVSEGTETSPV